MEEILSAEVQIFQFLCGFEDEEEEGDEVVEKYMLSIPLRIRDTLSRPRSARRRRKSFNSFADSSARIRWRGRAPL